MYFDPKSISRSAARPARACYGRFMQADPIGYGDGMNLYAYVRADPVNRRDSTGLQDDPIVVTGYRLRFSSAGGGGGMVSSSNGTCGEMYSTTADLHPRCLDRPEIGGPFEPAANGRGVVEVGSSVPASNEGRLLCSGSAYVLAGNPRLVGRIGGFNVPVREGSAAVIPEQFTGELRAGPAMRAIGRSAWGYTAGGQTFETFTDVVDERSIAPTTREAQETIMARAPGRLVVELVTGRHEGNTQILIEIPQTPFGCPQGTAPLMRF